jgi:hypothetical protein
VGVARAAELEDDEVAEEEIPNEELVIEEDSILLLESNEDVLVEEMISELELEVISIDEEDVLVISDEVLLSTSEEEKVLFRSAEEVIEEDKLALVSDTETDSELLLDVINGSIEISDEDERLLDESSVDVLIAVPELELGVTSFENEVDPLERSEDALLRSSELELERLSLDEEKVSLERSEDMVLLDCVLELSSEETKLETTEELDSELTLDVINGSTEEETSAEEDELLRLSEAVVIVGLVKDDKTLEDGSVEEDDSRLLDSERLLLDDVIVAEREFVSLETEDAGSLEVATAETETDELTAPKEYKFSLFEPPHIC